MSDLELKLKLTGDSRGMVGTVRASREEVDKLNKSVTGTADAGRKGAKGLDQVASSGRQADGEMHRLNTTTGSLLTSLAGLVSVGLVADEFNNMRKEAQLFNASLAEVSTLMDDLSEMSEISTQAKELTEAFGGLPTDQVKSFYNIYSAGADNAAEATATLTAANKLAIGGVAELDVAVDGLTSIMNAYEVSGGAAVGISDALFTAMRGGKTTISELSGSIGRVASLASSVDVDFDQLLAGISAITTGGVETTEAVTQVRQVIQGVIKPTAEATKLAEELGLEFNTTALGAQGLAGFLEEVREATGGNVDQMSLLFGSVEALSGAVALTGPQAGKFADILENMGNKAGATEDAYAKMAQDMQNQTDQLAGKFSVLRVEIGEAFVDASLPLVRAFNENFDETIAVVQAGTGVLVTFAGVYGTITAATWLATTAQNAFNAAVNKNPYVFLATTVAAAAIAIYSLRDAFDPARERAEELKREVEQLTSKLQGLSRAQLENQTFALQRQMVESQAEVRTLSSDLDKLQDKIRNSGQLTAQGGALPTATPEDIQRAGELKDRIEELEIAGESASIAYQQAKDQLEQLSRQSKETAESVDEVGGSVGRTKEEAEEFRDSVASLVDSLDPLGAAFESTFKKQQLLILAAQEGLISEEYRDRLITNLVEGMAEAGEESAERFVNPFEDSAARVSQAVQNAIASGEWDTIGDAIGNTLASSISSAIDTSITRSLSKDLTANSGIGQQLAAAFAGPLLGAVAGGVVQLAMRELGDYFSDDWDPTADRQAAQGTGTVLGDINAKSESIRRAVENSESGIDQLVGLNQGMLQALKNLQSAISGASDRIARGRSDVSIGMPGVMEGRDVFDDLTGGVLPLFDETLSLAFDFWDEATNILTLGLVDLGSLLGGKSKKRDEGIRIVGGYISDLIDETLVQAYATYRVKKHAFDDYDTKEKFSQLDDEVGRQFALVFESLYTTIESRADALGILPETIRNRLEDFEVATQRISLEGLDAAEQQAEIEAYFSRVFDNLTGAAVPFVSEFQRAGEGLGETLARVASQVGLLEEAIGTLTLDSGMSYYLTPEGSARIADSLANLSGGTEALASNLSGYENNFLSEADQFDLLTRRLGEAMNGLPLPETREGFVALLQAQNLLTSEGRENAATLLKLQDIANDYYDTVEDRAQELEQQEREALADLVSATDSALSALVSSVSDRKQTLTDAFNQEQQQIRDMTEARLAGNQLALDATAEGLRTLRDEVQGIVRAADSLRDVFEPIQQQRREQALDTLMRALETGDLGGTGEAADLVSRISAGDYSNSIEYERAQGQSLNLLAALEQEGGKQLTAAEEAVQRLEQQTKIIRDQGDSALDAAREEHEAEIQQLERLVTDAEDQLNTLRGIETGVLGIADALAGLATAIGAEFPRREVGDESLPPGDLVDNLYKAQGWNQYQQDDSGRQYWIDRIKDGLTGEALAAEFAAAGNAYLADQVPGFANGGTHTGGLRVVGERGPELEFTGPSRIFSHAQSRDLLDLSPVVKALGELEARLARLEAYQRQTTKNTGDIARSHTRWERAGIKTREVTS